MCLFVDYVSVLMCCVCGIHAVLSNFFVFICVGVGLLFMRLFSNVFVV